MNLHYKPTVADSQEPVVNLDISFFDSAVDNGEGRVRKVSLADLCKIVTKPTRKTKNSLPLLSPAKFMHSRKAENAYDWQAIAVDYDGEVVTFQEAIDQLEGVTALVHTSPSNAEGRPRWRVIFPLSNPIHDPDHYTILVDRINSELFDGVLAPESRNPGRPYFYGHVEGRNPIQAITTPGQRIDEIIKIKAADIEEYRTFEKSSTKWSDDPGEREFQGIAFHHHEGAKFREALMAIPDSVMERHGGRANENGWVDIVAASHGAYHGSDKGLDVIREVTELKCSNFDERELERLWNHFTRRSDSIDHLAGPGIVYKMAEDHGGWSQAEYDRRKAEANFDLAAKQAEEDDSYEAAINALSEVAHVYESFDWPDVAEQTDDAVIPMMCLRGGIGTIYGPPGCGKSTIAVSLASALASGERFQGLPCEKSTVLYIGAEDAKGIATRFYHEEARTGRDLSNIIVTDLYDFSYVEQDKLRKLLITVSTLKPFVIIDTKSVAFPTGDENTRDYAHEVYESARQIIKAGAKYVMLIDHVNAQQDMRQPRGHSATKGNFDLLIPIGATEVTKGRKKIQVVHEHIKAKNLPDKYISRMAWRVQEKTLDTISFDNEYDTVSYVSEGLEESYSQQFQEPEVIKKELPEFLRKEAWTNIVHSSLHKHKRHEKLVELCYQLVINDFIGIRFTIKDVCSAIGADSSDRNFTAKIGSALFNYKGTDYEPIKMEGKWTFKGVD